MKTKCSLKLTAILGIFLALFSVFPIFRSTKKLFLLKIFNFDPEKRNIDFLCLRCNAITMLCKSVVFLSKPDVKFPTFVIVSASWTTASGADASYRYNQRRLTGPWYCRARTTYWTSFQQKYFNVTYQMNDYPRTQLWREFLFWRNTVKNYWSPEPDSLRQKGPLWVGLQKILEELFRAHGCSYSLNSD